MLSNKEVQALLSKLCVDLGFCLNPEKENSILKSPPDNIESFTNAVFIAEGLDPTHAERQLYRQVRNVVSGAFKKHDEMNNL